MNKTVRRCAAVVSALALTLMPAQSCVERGPKQKVPVSVTVQRITFSSESRPRVYVGRVEAGKSTLISASCPGRLVRLDVRKGQRVSAGQVMAVVDAPTVKSLYETSKATFGQAQDALARVQKVYSAGGVSELKMMEVQTSYAKAEAAYNAAQRALEDCSIKAPYSGVVGEVLSEQGVEVGIAEPVFKLLDVGTVEVHASVPENEYSSYRVGQKARVTADAAGCTVDAVLSGKGFEASPLSHTYDFVFRPGSGAGNMMPGMVCKVQISPHSAPVGHVVIPSSSVRVDSEGRYVWCIGQDGAVVKKHIEVGGFSGNGIIVGAGLSEGDLLVVEGGRKISTGMRNLNINER